MEILLESVENLLGNQNVFVDF